MSCVSPAADSAGYRGKTGHAAERMAGLVRSARLAAQLDLDGKMLRTLTDDVVSSMEQDAGSIVSQYDSVQPPNAAMIALRTKADDALQPAESNLEQLRIAVRRGDRAGMRKAVASLAKSADMLAALRAEAS
jgi:hypothetical protein